MASQNRLLIDEFLALDWTTYGLGDLERLVRRSRYAATDDAWSDLDLLTSLLFRLEMYDRAKEHLENWIECNPQHAMTAQLRLRLVLCLNQLHEPQAALSHLDALMDAVTDSPSLICLKANLMNKCGKPRERVIATFEEAIAKATHWSEPKLELLEQLLLNGEFTRAQGLAGEYLGRAGLALRDRTVISALRLVSRFCQEPHCWELPEVKAEAWALRATIIPNPQREVWQFKSISEMLLDRGMSDPAVKQAAIEVRDWLKSLEPIFKKD